MVDLEPSQSVTETKTIKLRSLDRYGVACVSIAFLETTFGNLNGHVHARKFYFGGSTTKSFLIGVFEMKRAQDSCTSCWLVLEQPSPLVSFQIHPTFLKKSWRSVKLRFFVPWTGDSSLPKMYWKKGTTSCGTPGRSLGSVHTIQGSMVNILFQQVPIELQTCIFVTFVNVKSISFSHWARKKW